MKHIYALFSLTIILITSCNNQKTHSVEEYISIIDEIPISETFYVFEVDSNKNIIDTLALRSLKFDDNKNLIFEHNFQFKHNSESINYYNLNNGLIYAKVKKDDEIISDFHDVKF